MCIFKSFGKNSRSFIVHYIVAIIHPKPVSTLNDHQRSRIHWTRLRSAAQTIASHSIRIKEDQLSIRFTCDNGLMARELVPMNCTAAKTFLYGPSIRCWYSKRIEGRNVLFHLMHGRMSLKGCITGGN